VLQRHIRTGTVELCLRTYDYTQNLHLTSAEPKLASYVRTPDKGPCPREWATPLARKEASRIDARDCPFTLRFTRKSPLGRDRWRKYIWSDECSAERGKGKKQVWVFGVPSEKWPPQNVETYKKGKQLRVMVWAAFWGHSKRTPLYIMDRDFEAKKQGYSAASYIEVLEENLPFHYQDDLIFMQDNAPIHMAYKVHD
jgi:hypothetical protein